MAKQVQHHILNIPGSIALPAVNSEALSLAGMDGPRVTWVGVQGPIWESGTINFQVAPGPSGPWFTLGDAAGVYAFQIGGRRMTKLEPPVDWPALPELVTHLRAVSSVEQLDSRNVILVIETN